MKKVLVALLVVALLTVGLLVGCAGPVVTGSANLVTKTYDFSDFNRVEVGSAFEVDIAQSGSYSVSVTADDNLFDYILVSKRGSTLKIRLKTAHYIATHTKAEITMPELRGLELSGASKGTISGFSSTENAEIEVSGASSVNLENISAGDVKFNISGASKVAGDLTSSDVDFDISGASTVELEGSAKDIDVNASGASYVKLADFTVRNAGVKLSGASNGTVNLDGRLDTDLSGASNLKYIGEPTMGDIDTSGSSSIRKQ